MNPISLSKKEFKISTIIPYMIPNIPSANIEVIPSRIELPTQSIVERTVPTIDSIMPRAKKPTDTAEITVPAIAKPFPFMVGSFLNWLRAIMDITRVAM